MRSFIVLTALFLNYFLPELAGPAFGCVLKRKDWVEDDYLSINWPLPDHILWGHNLSDVQVIAKW